MPIVSQAQRGAMHAAAEGKSTLGIPKSVGQEFVAADKGGKLPPYKKIAAQAHRESNRDRQKRYFFGK